MMYKERYGEWAGNPNGHAPDKARCCEAVYSNQHRRSFQCDRKNGHGPDGAYCKQHDPDAVTKRRNLSKYKYDLKAYGARMRYLCGADKVIKSIADGHNDPRAACQEWLDKMGDSITPPKEP